MIKSSRLESQQVSLEIRMASGDAGGQWGGSVPLLGTLFFPQIKTAHLSGSEL